MRQSEMDEPGNDGQAEQLVRVLDQFVATLHDRSPNAGKVINDEASLDGSHLGQKPERFLVEELIRPVSTALDYSYRAEPMDVPGLNGGVPDFQVMNVTAPVIGEVKRPNEITTAKSETVDYLIEFADRPAAGIATDGFTWILYTATNGSGEISQSDQVPLRPALKKLNKKQSYDSEQRRRLLREYCAELTEQLSVERIADRIGAECVDP